MYTLEGINVSPTKRIYIKVPRGIHQLLLRWFLITEGKFCPSATCMQPGTRNDKHIVKFDAAVSNLNDIYYFHCRQEWHVLSDDSSIPCKGYYFIFCDVEYYMRWPCVDLSNKVWQ